MDRPRSLARGAPPLALLAVALGIALGSAGCVTQPDPDIPYSRPTRPVVSFDSVEHSYPNAGTGAGFETRPYAIVGVPGLVRTMLLANFDGLNARMQGPLLSISALRSLDPAAQAEVDWRWRSCALPASCSTDADCCGGTCFEGLCQARAVEELLISSVDEVRFDYDFGELDEAAVYQRFVAGYFEQSPSDDSREPVRYGQGRLRFDLGAIADDGGIGVLQLAFRNDASARRVNVVVEDEALLSEQPMNARYVYVRNADGSGSVSFVGPGGSSDEDDLVSLAAYWTAEGAGRGAVLMTVSGLGDVRHEECWGADGLTVWGETAPMTIGLDGGSLDRCPAELRDRVIELEPRVEAAGGEPSLP